MTYHIDRFMTASVVPFRSPKNQPSSEDLAARVRELSVTSDNIRFDAPHVRQRMLQRKISMRQVLEVLRHGECVSRPKLDEYGDWRIKLKRVVAGRRVQVVVAVKRHSIAVVTTI